MGSALPSAPVPVLLSPNTIINPSPLAAQPLSLSPSAVPTLPSPSVAVPVIINIAVPAAVSLRSAAAPSARPVDAAANPKFSALFDGPSAASGEAPLPLPVPAPAPEPSIPSAPEQAPPPATPPAAPLGSGIRMARPEHEAWLASVVDLLAVTRTGRRVLRDIDALALRRGVPILLDVKPIGNNGEFRYDSDMLIMDSGHLKRDPYQSAPILAHEFQHVLQRALELPVDALELEIESYTVESRVWTELGVEPAVGTFARDARRELKKGMASFVTWLGKQYKNNIPLYGSTMDAYVEKLEKNLEKAKKSEALTRKKIRILERVLEAMKENGMSDEAIAAHRREDMEPLERSLVDGVINRGWIERDLMRLKEPAIRAAFRAYARGVARRARSLSRP